MTIQYAILGLLSWREFSGYELKKVIADSAVFYWSGNNNQIYRTLIQLQKDGMVTHQILEQESRPDKKVYSITDRGLSALRDWLRSTPETPELRNTFLIQLAWASQLDDVSLISLIDHYEDEVQYQLLMQREKAQRGWMAPKRNRREAYLWEMIAENIRSTYENELEWVRKLKEGLA